MKQSVGAFLFDYLYKQGIHDAFGIPGDFVLPTYRWLQESPINIYTMTHEPSVGFAADCYARSKGLGLAVVTYCVGGLNMLNSVACAYAEESPLIVVSGGPSPKDRHKNPMFHHKVRNFDTQHSIFKEVTCASAILNDPATAAQEIVRVVEEVKRHSRPGYIEVPFDVTDLPIEIPNGVLMAPAPPESDPEVLKACVREMVERINAAKQPVIITGVELHRFRLTDYVSRLAKQFHLPIAGTLMGKSVVSETSPTYIGVYSGSFSEPAVHDYVHGSDCVVLLGAHISDVLLGFYSSELHRERTIIVNSEKTDVGLHTYRDLRMKDILAGLVDSDLKPRKGFVNPNPAKEVQPILQHEHGYKLTANDLFRILASRMDERSTLVCDTGDALIGAIGIRSGKQKRFFSDAYYLSMGFAAPAAVGAMVADPEAKVIAVIGDGAFQMTGMELSTAAKYKLAPVVIILNNDGYGTQRHILDGPFNDITRWQYHKVTDMIGYGTSRRVVTLGEMDSALQEALHSDTLYVIEAMLDRDDASDNLHRMGEALGKLRRGETGKR